MGLIAPKTARATLNLSKSEFIIAYAGAGCDNIQGLFGYGLPSMTKLFKRTTSLTIPEAIAIVKSKIKRNRLPDVEKLAKDLNTFLRGTLHSFS